MTDTPPARVSDWDFLFEWFYTLGEGATPCNSDGLDDVDDIRVGRDARDDSWIELRLGRDELDPGWDLSGDDDDDDDSDDDGFFGSEQQWLKKPIVREQLRSKREALALTSIVAQVDYDGWLDHVDNESGIPIPPHWLVPDESGRLPRIPVRFKLMLENRNDMAFLDWNETLSHLLGTNDYSDEYKADLERIHKVLERRGIPLESIQPTPMIIRLDFNGQLYVTGDIRGRLLRLVDSVQRTQRIVRDADPKMRGVLFTIEALEIDFLRTELHDHIVEALIMTLQAGVPVRYLRMPQLRSELPSFTTWSTFVRLLLGVDNDDEGRLASVRRIIIPATYAGIFHFAPFCSALAYARGVEIIHFAGSRHPDGTDAFGVEGKMDRAHVWRWLTFALLSKESQSSVTRLILDGERPLPQDTLTIKAMMDSDSPLLALYESSFTSADPAPIPASALKAFKTESTTIPRWTIIRILDGSRGDTDCQTNRDLTGQWLATHPTSGDALVFVPGHGFCLASAPARATKRPKVPSNPIQLGPSLDSIVFTPGQGTAMNSAALEKILSVVGSRLRSLRFTLDSTAATMRAVFASCPNLHSLAVTGLSLNSMDVFEKAYANGAKITSLSLGHVVTTEASARAFVRQLASSPPTAMARTLERLYWNVQVRQRPGHVISAVDEFKLMFERNKALTHVCGVPRELKPDTLHAQRIPGRTKSEQQRLSAFLGAVGVHAAALDEPVRRRIWGFAEELRHRSVVASEW